MNNMANLRESPYIWVTWLAKIMVGDTVCQWQSWFQSQNQLTEKQPSDFDLIGWKIDHTKMLTEFKEGLIKVILLLNDPLNIKSQI